MTIKPFCLATLLLAIVGLQPLASQGRPRYCAFEVVVKSSDGSPVSGALVSVLSSSGQTYSTATSDQRGIADVCDAPAGLIDIAVGGNRCGAVLVRYLRSFWMETRRVSVTYKNCAGEEWAEPAACELTLRVRDNRGDPLAGVALADSANRTATREPAELSDRFGRIFRFMKYGETVSGRLEKPGYLPETITELCKQGESYQKDRTVTLQTLGPVRR